MSDETKLGRELAELERTNPEVKAAAENYDRVRDSIVHRKCHDELRAASETVMRRDRDLAIANAALDRTRGELEAARADAKRENQLAHDVSAQWMERARKDREKYQADVSPRPLAASYYWRLTMTRNVLIAAVLALLAGCGEAQTADVSGEWAYDWQTRADGSGFPWDGHFHGMLSISQDGHDLVGTLGYPAEDPMVLFGDPTPWDWPVAGTVEGSDVLLTAPNPSQPWRFELSASGDRMEGKAWPVAVPEKVWPFIAQRGTK
jgi:hypothetical protein